MDISKRLEDIEIFLYNQRRQYTDHLRHLEGFLNEIRLIKLGGGGGPQETVLEKGPTEYNSFYEYIDQEGWWNKNFIPPGAIDAVKREFVIKDNKLAISLIRIMNNNDEKNLQKIYEEELNNYTSNEAKEAISTAFKKGQLRLKMLKQNGQETHAYRAPRPRKSLL